MLSDSPNRAAQFRTVITLISHEQDLQVEGVVKGQIATVESGEQGFGYDSLFIPKGHACTFAMLSAEAKNAISHRARALHALRAVIK
jgi:XTP/dITP diphosphohydrolase